MPKTTQQRKKTDDIIKNLQNQIDNLKQQEQNKADSKLTQFYQRPNQQIDRGK